MTTNIYVLVWLVVTNWSSYERTEQRFDQHGDYCTPYTWHSGEIVSTGICQSNLVAKITYQGEEFNPTLKTISFKRIIQTTTKHEFFETNTSEEAITSTFPLTNIFTIPGNNIALKDYTNAILIELKPK